MSSILIGLVFAVTFFIESVIGFGGSLIAFGILGFFVDLKQLILISIYIGTVASTFVIASDYKKFNKTIFIGAFPFCLMGTIIGSVLFIYNDSSVIKMIFGAFLLLFASKIMFFDNIKIPRHFSNLALTIGGISHGLFGVGGPFFALALKEKLKTKSEMRATLAALFISFNFIRVFQLSLQDSITFGDLFKLWWVAAPLAISIHLGHLVHKKISESAFKKIVAIVATFSGIEFLFTK